MNCKNFARKLSATGLLAAMLAGVLLSGQAPGGEAQAASKSQLKSRLSELKAARAEADAAVKALQAGVDMILMPQDLQAAFDGVKQALSDGTLTQARIDESVLRILQVKAEYNILQ